MNNSKGPLLHAVVVTYRRPEELRKCLGALLGQTRPPDTVTVVDNDGDPEVQRICAGFPTCRYVGAAGNHGPAGGLATGVAALRGEAAPDDWVVFVDDDDPPQRDDVLEVLQATCADAARRGVRVGAVGCAGARFHRRTGRLRRLPDAALTGVVDVDYIGGNQFPTYSMAALAESGGPNAELFFGFDDLELGLRIQDAGYRLLAPGDLWLNQRSVLGRLGMSARDASGVRRRSPWRGYYSARNQIWIARQYGGLGAALLTTLGAGVAAAAIEVYISRSLRTANTRVRGIIDAWRGRLGKTISPD